jgi:creatinine amidohydrolase/Fe(II)-dependent formamide hydrolase-like protein
MNKMLLSPFYSSLMTFGEIREILKTCSAIILPICATEPIGSYGTMGASMLSCTAIANAVSEKKRILLSPKIPYGYSIAYRAFESCGALSEKTLRSVLVDLIKSWMQQNISTVIILNGIYENNRITKDAISWIQSRNPKIKVCLFSWQHSSEIRSFIAKSCKGSEYCRSEYGILSMAAFLDARFIRTPVKHTTIRTNEKTFQKWEKTGRDPEKFKKLFPDAITSAISSEFNPEFGEKLFHFVCDVFSTKIKHDLNI